MMPRSSIGELLECPFVSRACRSGPLCFRWKKHGLGRGEGQRMAHEGAGKERHPDFGKRRVAVLPLAAIEGVHEFRIAGHDSDRDTPPPITLP